MPEVPIKLPFQYFPFPNSWTPYLILAILGLGIYINTVRNEFALDDGIVIHKNEYVMEGLGGIDSIMSRDAYHSFYKQMNAKAQLAGGRYRPLSIVSFAVEQEFIGKYADGKLPPANCWDKNGNKKGDPEEDINQDHLYNDNDCLTEGCFTRHLNNVLFYVLSVLLMYALLKNHLFPNKPDLAFIAALIFCVHPLHTEVVANMKSRDEIFSMLFITLTFINIFKFLEKREMKYVIWSGVNLFLALLSKEYAVTMIALIPMTLFLYDLDFDAKGAKAFLFLMLFGIFALLSVKQAKTHGMLVAIVSIVGLGLYAKYMNFGKYTWLFYSLGIACTTYFCIRFAIVVGKPEVPDTEILNNPYLLATKAQKKATEIFVCLKYLYLLFFPAVLSADYSYKTIEYRNYGNWDTLLSILIYTSLIILTVVLFFKRKRIAFPFLFFFANFFMVNNLLFDIGATMGERLIYHSSFGFAILMAWLMTEKGKEYIKNAKLFKPVLLLSVVLITFLCSWRVVTRNEEWKNDITLFTHDVITMPNSVLCLGNAGARWIDLSERPENSKHEKEYLDKAIGYLNHALELHPKYVNGYLNLGLAYFKLKDYNKAEEIWSKAYSLYPSNPFLVTYFRVLSNVYIQQAFADAKDKKINFSLYWFERAAKIFPQDPEIWYNLGGAAFSLNDFPKAKMAFKKCLELKPDHPQAKNGLANCPN